MNTHFVTIASTSKKRAYLAAILCGTLLTTPGCKIPGLRCALPGAPVPAEYNWNNGLPLWSSNTTTHQASIDSENLNADEDSEGMVSSDPPGDERSDVQNASDSNPPMSIASFIRAASYLTPKTQDTEKSKAIDVEIKKMEADLGKPDELRELETPKADGDQSADDAVSLPAGPDFGMIDTNIGPTDSTDGIALLENSAQLPQAAFYNDPYLFGLITDTLTGNQELKILSEEIRIAGNETYARSGEYLPFVSLGAGAGLEKPGQHTRAGAVEEQLEVAPGTGFPDPLGDFRVGATASWEIDIWKKLRTAQRAAAVRYLATQEGRTYIVTRVVAEVAENYYTLLALDNRLETLQATIAIQQQSLTVARAKKEAGRATELAVQRFQAEVQKNLSERSIIQQEIVETENRINFLAGRYPQPVERIRVEFVDVNLTTLGAGVPSELLLNRADIREAERQVAAAGLDVQVARTRFYPSLNLTAGLGWNAFSTGYLFQTPESLAYGLAGELVGPLINKRAIKAAYASANAAQLQAIYNYQQTVLQAHIEVVNQITKVENYRRSIEVKKRQLESLTASVDVAGKLFQNARAEYVEVLLAQRELMEAKMQLIDIKKEQLGAVVNAYQALGGGGF